jgi:hypothetical protein
MVYEQRSFKVHGSIEKALQRVSKVHNLVVNFDFPLVIDLCTPDFTTTGQCYRILYWVSR